jgi:hypothetical protein
MWAAGALGMLILGLSAAFYFATSTPRPVDSRLLQHPRLSASGYPGVTAGAPTSQTTAAVRPGLPHPFQVPPPHHDRMADFDKYSFLKNAQKLATRDNSPGPDGTFRRVSLYRTSLKYPFVRVEEQIQRLPGGQEVVLSENAVVADHVIVRAQPGSTATDIANAAAQDGYSVLVRPTS